MRETWCANDTDTSMLIVCSRISIKLITSTQNIYLDHRKPTVGLEGLASNMPVTIMTSEPRQERFCSLQ